MSAPRRHQFRDRLGRFTSAGGGARDGRPPGARTAGSSRLGHRPWVAGLARVTRRGLAVLRGEVARRLYRLAVVAVALAAAVVLLYEHGDGPAALARTVQAAPSAAAPPARPGTSAARARDAEAASRPSRSEPPAAAKPAQATEPTGAAAAWYAARNHLRAGQVRPLQQDKVSKREVRVLVLADRGNGRLDTALVTVRRDAQGRWSVP